MDTLHHGNSRGVPVREGQRVFFFFFSVCGFVLVISDKQRAELTQQHTEWSRQMTQRHMQQIEDLQAQLQAHTQMMALQQVTHTRSVTTTLILIPLHAPAHTLSSSMGSVLYSADIIYPCVHPPSKSHHFIPVIFHMNKILPGCGMESTKSSNLET